MTVTGKQRMLNAYKGIYSDRIPIAPEFWYYYPAKVLGVDMIEFQKNVPFHQALKTTFDKFACEGWGITFCGHQSADIENKSEEIWLNDDELLVTTTQKTPKGTLTRSRQMSKDEPSWSVEQPVKDFEKDLPIYEYLTLAGNPEKIHADDANKALAEVGDSYLLECYLGDPFFDYFAQARNGGLEAAIFDFFEHGKRLEELQEKYIDHKVRFTRALCEQTNFDSFFIGCSWSCNCLIGPDMWRKWDKPYIKAICDEVHRHNKLLHIHFHGTCMDTVADFAEIGIDCVCPFERPPGGDIKDLTDLRTVEKLLHGKTAMSGNIHTVETLIRGNPEDARRQVREVLEAFKGNPRVIVGTGDQVGKETPEENLHAMIEEAKRLSPELYH